jgi:hypothetical protein
MQDAVHRAGWSAVYEIESGLLFLYRSLGLAAAKPDAGRPELSRSLSKQFIEECGGEADIARYCTTSRRDAPDATNVEEYGIHLPADGTCYPRFSGLLFG